jgi:hypothetical protein
VVGKTEAPSNVTGFAYQTEEFGIRLRWTPISDPDARGYEIRVGGTDWDTATFVAFEAHPADNHLWRVQLSTPQTARIRSKDTTGNYSALTTSISVSATVPGSVSPLVYVFEGVEVRLTWGTPSSSYAIDSYEIRYGVTWEDGASNAVRVKTLTFKTKVSWLGTRKYWVAAVDSATNVGVKTSVDILIEAPAIPNNRRSEIIDNNVLLYWDAPTSTANTLPIDRYEVRKGATWAGGTPVGSNADSTFSAIFEQVSGAFTYWVAAYDSANNPGTPGSIVATVAQPPDYVLRLNYDSNFSLGTRTNMLFDGGVLRGPFDLTETWATHFSSRGWASIDDQIATGYPLYLQPSTAGGAYEETIDYGVVLAACNVTATLAYTVPSGTVTVSCQIYYKTLIGDPWTAAATGQAQVFLSNFRYVRVVWTFTSTAGANNIEVTAFNVKLAAKLKTDSGYGTAASGDVGGTTVTFNVPFVDVESINVTPLTTTARYATYDFVDTPNPTTFKVLLFDSAGARVSGNFSWTARGY